MRAASSGVLRYAIFLGAAVAFTSVSATAEVRDVDLSGCWDFTYTAEFPIQPAMPLAEAFTCRIAVPGYWDAQRDNFRNAAWWKDAQFNPTYRPIEETMSEGKDAELPYLCGVGWCRRRFDVPEDWQGRSVVLYVGGVVRHCHVYLNGEYLGYYFGDFTPFEFDLSRHLKFGENNELVLAVTNLDREGYSCGYRGYHGFSAGISGAVRLHVSGGAGRIQSVFLRPVDERKNVRWWVELDSPFGTEGRPSRLAWRVVDRTGREVQHGTLPVRALEPAETYRAEWDVPRGPLELWSTWDPRLYNAEITWEGPEGKIWDRKNQRFGLRTLEARGTDLLLNGRPIMFRGGHDSYYFAPRVHPPTPMTVDYFRPRMETLKKLGYNALRFHTWTPFPEYLEAADEAGILLEVERPVYMGKNPHPDPRFWAERECDTTWRQMVYWSRRHPSVAIYCGGNESMLSEQMIAFWENCRRTAKRLDPGCLVMPMQAMRNIEYARAAPPPHVWDPKGYYDWLLDRITKSTDVFGQYAWGHLSYSPVTSNVSAKKLAGMLEIYRRPILTHEPGIAACYLDLSLEKRYDKDIPPDLYRVARRRLEAAGRGPMARRYYENSCRWQALCLKYGTEKIRRCPVVDGYDHLGVWDLHWHRSGYSCGWMNEFFELKFGRTPEFIREFNDESVVLLDAGRQRNVRPGREFSREVLASLYGGRPLQHGVLHWTLERDEKPLLRGRMTGLTAPDGGVSSLGNLTFTWPKVERACKATLRLTLSGDGYDMTNHWDYWIFPERKPPTVRARCDAVLREALAPRYAGLLPADSPEKTPLWIAADLRPEHLKHLAAGGDVLLLGSRPFPTRTTRFQIGNAGRPNHNVATVIYDHPLFRGFPQEGFCDWQFYPMFGVGGCRATVFCNLKIPFDPILEVVSSYKDVKLQAAIWEARIQGGGRLLVDGCGVDVTDPGGAELLDRILDYTTGPRFEPRTSITIAKHLAPWVGKKIRAEPVQETDKAGDPNVNK
ncbi:MAG: hypothetical protein JXB10_01625 [Pirellulales bacterium]|nr:hypothetical protein [Pirellulales bacterium]